MKPHELNRMFHALTPTPEREKALLEELLQNDTRRERSVKNWKRMAVCVAAAALLTACTVGAAAIASFFHTKKTEITEEFVGFFSVSAEIAYVPLDSLSDEIKAQEGQGLEDNPFSNKTYFDSWERVEEFVGLDLMNNPVLDAAAEEIPYSALDTQFFDSRYVVMHDSNLRAINVHGGYQTGDVGIRVDYDIFTDRSLEVEDERVRGTYLWYDHSEEKRNGVEIEEETYTAPNGLETVIVKENHTNDGRKSDCTATVSLNGIRATIVTCSPNSVEEARKIMIKVLNGFTP